MLKKEKENIIKDINALLEILEKVEDKSETYIEIAKKYRSIYDFKQSNDFLKKANENIEVNFLLAENYHSNEDYPKAEEFYEKVIEDINNDFVGNAYYGLGTLGLRRQELDKAKNFFEKAIEWNKTKEEYFELGKNYNLLASVTTALGNNKLALEYFEEAIDWNSKTKNYDYLGKSFHNLDIFLSEAMSQENRLVYYSRILENSGEDGSISIQAFANQAIGEWYQSNANILDAKFYFEEALKLKKQENIIFGLGELYYHLGSVYEYEKAHQKAIKYHVLALRKMLEVNELEQVGLVAYFLETALPDCESQEIKKEAQTLMEEIKTLGFVFDDTSNNQSEEAISEEDLEDLKTSSFGENIRQVSNLESQNNPLEHIKNSYHNLKENLPKNVEEYFKVAQVLLNRLEEKYKKAFLYKNKKRKAWESTKTEVQEELQTLLQNETLNGDLKQEVEEWLKG